MELYVPDTLTVDNAEKYEASIRLRPGGLSFAGHDPSEKDSFFYGATTFDVDKAYPEALKDVFFAHEFFSYPYRRIHIVCAVDRVYTLVPDVVFDEKSKERLLSFVHVVTPSRVLHEPAPAPGSQILFTVDDEVYAFCARSLVQPQFTHAVTPLLRFWRKRNRTAVCRQLYVSVYDRIMFAAIFDNGALTFQNAFEVNTATDVLFYTLYIYKYWGLNQTDDELLLTLSPSTYGEIEPTLRKYVLHVERLATVADAKYADADIPYDITALFTCAS